MSTPLASTQSAAAAIVRVNYSHDAMIDLIISTPGITHNALAAHFGYTPAWVSRVVNSDAFQARLAERKTELVDPALVASIEEKIRAAADKSLDVVLEKLHLVPTLDQALNVAKEMTKALGFGARDRGVTVQNNFVVALPGKAASAEEWAARNAPAVPANVVAVQERH